MLWPDDEEVMEHWSKGKTQKKKNKKKKLFDENLLPLYGHAINTHSHNIDSMTLPSFLWFGA